MERLFTPDEANETLPLVRRIVEDILATGKLAKDIAEKHALASREVPEFDKAMKNLDELMKELEAIGCSFRDWNYEIGLVDFPAIIDGEEVLLCWRSDEPRVMYYHGVNAGYRGRRLIPGMEEAQHEGA